MGNAPSDEHGSTQEGNSTRSSSRHFERDETLIDQYTHYAESAMAVSERRLRTNRFYVSLLSGILVVVTFIAQGPLYYAQQVGLIAIGLLGISCAVSGIRR